MNAAFSVGLPARVAVRSATLPASTYSFRLPPPQLKNTSGGFGEPSATRSFCLYGSLPKVCSVALPLPVELNRVTDAFSIGLRLVSCSAQTVTAPVPPAPAPALLLGPE